VGAVALRLPWSATRGGASWQPIARPQTTPVRPGPGVWSRQTKAPALHAVAKVSVVSPAVHRPEPRPPRLDVAGEAGGAASSAQCASAIQRFAFDPERAPLRWLCGGGGRQRVARSGGVEPLGPRLGDCHSLAPIIVVGRRDVVGRATGCSKHRESTRSRSSRTSEPHAHVTHRPRRPSPPPRAIAFRCRALALGRGSREAVPAEALPRRHQAARPVLVGRGGVNAPWCGKADALAVRAVPRRLSGRRAP
jgi:hypothetical protein